MQTEGHGCDGYSVCVDTSVRGVLTWRCQTCGGVWKETPWEGT